MTMPPLRPGRVPRFHELGDDTFEDLCRDLAQEEDDVDSAERYGRSGQRQLGIDLLIELKDDSLVAGQCKSHEKCDEDLIRTACDDFLKHGEHWRNEGVRTFILFVAADTRRTQLHNERLKQRARLKQKGFGFKVWSGAVLKTKLRKRRHIVRHFLPSLEDYICGPETQLEVQSRVQEATIVALAGQLGEAAEGEHADLRQLWRDGRPQEALTKLRQIKSNSLAWTVVPPGTKAKLLRLEGRLLVTFPDIAAAKRLSAEADQLDQSGTGRSRLIAMIAQAEGRLDVAVAALTSDDDPDSQALKAALQIQLGQIDTALETLSALTDHPEAHRLRALILLSQREPLKAKVEAEKALSLAPSWYWIRRTAATIRYLAGLSPAVLPNGFPEWPEPLNSRFVRDDDESVAARRLAAIEFEKLSSAEFEHSPDEIASLQAWRVACLADNPGSHQEATGLARVILEANPSNYRVMAWVLGRDLDVATEFGTAALADKVAHAKATVEEIATLVAAYAMTQRFVEAQEVLEQTREIFIRESAPRLWDFWQLQLSALKADSEQEPSAGAETKGEQILARLRDAEAAGDRDARWRQYMLLAQLGRWDEIAPVANELVDSLQTSDAVRIASHALYNTGDFAGCLAILDKAPALFFKGELSPDLRRLRVLAQRATGALPEAITTARELFEQLATREAFMELARLYFQVGDFKNLAIVARRHSAVADSSAFDYLTLALYLKIEDPLLATVLWTEAIRRRVEDDHVGMAFEIGNALGLGVELKPLVERLTALGAEGKGGIRAVALEELIEWSAQRREQLDQIWRQLRRGELPNHLALNVLGIGVARAFHRFPLITASRTDGNSVGLVSQRFGGRIAGSLPFVAGQTWRLHADVTAILGAAHFGLLPAIETQFAPIRLSQNTVVALSSMQDSIRPNQPNHVEAVRKILGLVSVGKIATQSLEPVATRQESEGDVAGDVLQVLRHAAANGSLALDFLPPRSMDPLHSAMSVPIQYSALLRDAHSVVDALQQCGALSEAEHRNAIEGLGQRGGVPSEAAILPRTKLLCRSAVIKLLALAGVLDLAAATFTLSIPADDLNRDQLSVEAASVAEADAEWLGQLIDHLRAGLASGTYALLPHMDHEVLQRDDATHVLTPEETVLLDLLKFGGTSSDVIWTDDRWLHSHDNCDAKRIVGTVDLLFWLKDAGTMSETALIDSLTNMRASDVRFVAFDEAELLGALLEASIEHGRLVETKKLRVLRQYYARCLREGDALRPPHVGVPNSMGEWPFLFSCGHAIANAMLRVWEQGSNDHAAARCEWLLRNMYTEDRGIHGTGAPTTEVDDIHRVTVSLVGLIANVIQLDGDEHLRQARRDYLKWVYERVMRTRFATDADSARSFVEQLKDTILRTLGEDDEARGALVLRLMGRLWFDLPQDVRRLLEPDQAFLRKLGVSMKSVVEIGPLRIERQAFWDTLLHVVNESLPGDLTTIEGHIVRIEPLSDQPLYFSAHCDDPKFDGHIGGPEFGFLSDSFAARESAFAQLPHWFDVPQHRRDELKARIIGGEDAGTRIELATQARAASGAELYRRLFDSLKEGETLRLTDALPTRVDVLVDHLRIDKDDPSHTRWAKNAAQLVSDIGVVDAAQRLGGLPIPLPEVFVSALSALSPRERRRSLRLIRRIWLASPVGLVHLAELWLRLPHVGRHAVTVRTKVLRALCKEDHRPAFEAWLTTLRWVDEQFGFDASARGLPVGVRLALVWTHADRVFRILMARGLPPDWIEEAFDRNDYPVGPELVFTHATYIDDIAAPRRVCAEAFVLSAFTLLYADGGAHASARMLLEEAMGQMNDIQRATFLRTILTDTRNTTDLLGSWLANNRGWLQFSGDQIEQQFTFEGIDTTVVEACKAITEKRDERRSWFQLSSIVDEVRPVEIARQALEDVFLEIDVIEYMNRDPTLAIAAMGVMASQARFMSNEAKARIETQLLDAAKTLSGVRLEPDDYHRLSTSILAGLVACAWSTGDGARASSLANLIERLADADAALFIKSGPFISRLGDALPAIEARHFWRLRDLLRLKSRI